MVKETLICALIVIGCVFPANAGNDQAPAAFVRGSFMGQAPEMRVLWLTGDIKETVREIMGHDLGRLRLRYWADGRRTAWILEEIGKEELITAGIVVDVGKIESLQVLAYRESRGFEVRYPFFTDQFRGAGLGAKRKLDRPIDGISGATLSVRALTKLARLALALDQYAAQAGTEAY